MTQHRNTLNGIASEKMAANSVTSALLRDQIAFHVEFSGSEDIHRNYRCTDSTGRKGIVVNNAHHDAPMGGEMYYIFEHVEEEEDTEEES